MSLADNTAAWCITMLAGLVLGFAGRPYLSRAAHKEKAKEVEVDRLPWRNTERTGRLEMFEAIGHAKPIVFIGDSRIEKCEWSELLGAEISNRGISGDTVKGVLSRLPQSVPRGTRLCVVQVGYEDSFNGSPDNVAENLAAIIKAAPAARVVITSIIPDQPNAFGDRNPTIAEANKKAKAAVEAVGGEWLDLSPIFGERLQDEVAMGSYGLNGEGYRRLAEALKPLVTSQP